MKDVFPFGRSDASVRTGDDVAVILSSLPAQDEARRGHSGFTSKLSYPERDSLFSDLRGVLSVEKTPLAHVRTSVKARQIGFIPRLRKLVGGENPSLPANSENNPSNPNAEAHQGWIGTDIDSAARCHSDRQQSVDTKPALLIDFLSTRLLGRLPVMPQVRIKVMGLVVPLALKTVKLHTARPKG